MITCNQCKTKFEIPEESRGKAEELSCPQCHSRLKVKWKIEVEVESQVSMEETEAGKIENVRPSGLKVLVAVDGEATQDVMKEILTGAGHEVLLASTGKEALSILEKERPQIAYLDVALPQVLGFEVCEIIKKSSQLKATKVILVSAIYDKTRYKRAPSSLYGADDYIERHHIQDGLILKLSKLLNPGEEPSSALPSKPPGAHSIEVMDKESLSPRPDVSEAVSLSEPVESVPPFEKTSTPTPILFESVDEPFVEKIPSPDVVVIAPEAAPEISLVSEAQESQMLPQEPAPLLSPEENEKHEAAKRFARLIISDIALYNQKAIEEGIENGNIEEILKDEMAEAEKLFRERVSKELREKTPYLQDALRDLIERKMKLMKQSK